MENKIIVIICQDFPYPLDYAGPIDSFNKIKALYEVGYQIHLVATVKREIKEKYIEEVSRFCKKIYLIKRNYSPINLLSPIPFQIASRLNDIEIDRIIENLNGNKVSSIICDGYYCIGILERLTEKISTKYLYLRVNNNEPLYFKALAKSTNNFFKKTYYQVESFKFLIHEIFILKKIKIYAFLHVSIEEKNYYESRFSKSKHFFLPAGIDTSMMIPYQIKNSHTAVFIGSLFMPNNLEGVYWYIRNIHDKLTERFLNYRFLIAGNTRGVIDERLSNLIENRKNIEFIDSPELLDPVYSAGTVFVNPMLNGAGVKLKSLNAICAGLPVVTTLVGNEGTGLLPNTHVLTANTSEDFLQNIVSIFENESIRKNLVNNAQDYLMEYYDQSSSLCKFISNNEYV